MFPSEVDGPVERVDGVKEGIQTATIPGQNEKVRSVVDVGRNEINMKIISLSTPPPLRYM